MARMTDSKSVDRGSTPLSPANQTIIIMAPTLGRIVHYVPTAEERGQLNASGNNSEVLPAIIVGVWTPETVNLKVFTDGNGPDIWATSVVYGEGERTWSWPPRANEVAPTTDEKTIVPPPIQDIEGER